MEELSFSTISEHLKLPVNTLKVRASRAKKELYKQLK
jgi:DNA-directed RNA polymerase specialized sigma24 family protein